jgi:anaerobic selenocysteine-containing dehydrogenase
MAITQAITTSFKRQLMEGSHDFTVGGHAFKIALFTSAASLNATTTDYSTSNEVVGLGYTAGGQALTNVAPAVSGTTVFLSFADVTFSTATLTARGALIYNTETGGGSGTTDAVCVLDFGTDKTATAEDFTITFPAAAAGTAIIQVL